MVMHFNALSIRGNDGFNDLRFILERVIDVAVLKE
jgi:hypothetical protein